MQICARDLFKNNERQLSYRLTDTPKHTSRNSCIRAVITNTVTRESNDRIKEQKSAPCLPASVFRDGTGLAELDKATPARVYEGPPCPFLGKAQYSTIPQLWMAAPTSPGCLFSRKADSAPHSSFFCNPCFRVKYQGLHEVEFNNTFIK